MTIAPFIFGIAGTSLSQAERNFFTQIKPWGYILFARNIKDEAQLLDLTQHLHALHAEKTFLLIDQEGGRVRRLKPPLALPEPPMLVFAELYNQSPTLAKTALTLLCQQQTALLNHYQIAINCAPMVDLLFPFSHQIIGDRALGRDCNSITELARHYMAGLLTGGVLPVIKHIPGHGRAELDSHCATPHVLASHQTLTETDFLVFKNLCQPATTINPSPAPPQAKVMPITPNLPTLAMTAHVVYDALDNQQVATLSPMIINQIIRKEIGFQGLLMTDDLAMRALYPPETKPTADMVAAIGIKALTAGCDLLLHCNGVLAEMVRFEQILDYWQSSAMTKARTEFHRRNANCQAQYQTAQSHKNLIAKPNKIHAELCQILKPYWTDVAMKT